MKRRNVVAGSFYPRFKNEIVNVIEECFNDKEFGPGQSLEIGNSGNARKTLGGICPHAGYIYSGAAAAHTYNAIFKETPPDTFIILGNTHTGYPNISLMSEGEWETPLGDLKIDSSIANSLLSSSDLIINDESAFFGNPHGREHNIEVQLPFIKYGAIKSDKEIKIIPIKIGKYDLEVLKNLGEVIGKVIEGSKKDVVIIASSDMFHESPQNRKNTKKEIEGYKKRGEPVRNSIKSLNSAMTLEIALKIGSICGPQTITTAMIACKKLGATKGEVLKYYTSYEKTVGEGPTDYCVAYLSAIFVN